MELNWDSSFFCDQNPVIISSDNTWLKSFNTRLVLFCPNWIRCTAQIITVWLCSPSGSLGFLFIYLFILRREPKDSTVTYFHPNLQENNLGLFLLSPPNPGLMAKSCSSIRSSCSDLMSRDLVLSSFFSFRLTRLLSRKKKWFKPQSLSS